MSNWNCLNITCACFYAESERTKDDCDNAEEASPFHDRVLLCFKQAFNPYYRD